MAINTKQAGTPAARLEKYGVPYMRVIDNTLLRDLLSWIDAGIGAILSAAQAQARAVPQQHRELLERGAQELLDQETLDEDAIRGYKAAMGTRSIAPTSRAQVAA